MNAPTAADVRNWSRLNFDRLGYSEDPDLQVLVDRAVGYVNWVSGQTTAGMPVDLEALAQQAIQMRTEQIAMQGRAAYVESASENDVISSFSAGLYSETRRDPARRGEQRSINTWPALDELLWMLMTDDRHGFWLAYLTGTPIPAFSVEEVLWGPHPLVYPWDSYLAGRAGVGGY